MRVLVHSPARLHLGFLDMEGELGRRFGSLGLTIEDLWTELAVTSADAFSVTGAAEVARGRAMLDRLASAWKLPPLKVAIERTIPAHAGLGSGTQLALALGAASAKLAGVEASPRQVAQLLQRGTRSGIGIGAFEEGGFILDGGRGTDGLPPPLVSRLTFPADWRVLLIFDPAHEGLHGAGEDGAFHRLPPYTPELAGRLCRLVVMQLLPGIATVDLAAVGAAIGEIQRRVGDYFAPAQNGRFASPAVSEVLAWLEAAGVTGLGQSSWGPTGFAILAGEAQAAALQGEAERRFGQQGLRFMVTRARNRGAEVEVVT
ncbi:MAG: beta-ribofuranosylaminobenzene 5'-phosphate synthase family protein [Geminicoccaceae bacterium]